MPQAARYKGRQKTGALRCLSPRRGSGGVGDGPGAARYALAPGYLLIAPSALILALQVLIVAEALVSPAGSVRAFSAHSRAAGSDRGGGARFPCRFCPRLRRSFSRCTF